MKDDNLIALALVFIPLSVASFGGGMSVVASVQHQSIDVHNWMTEREFLNLFAISRSAPGPGSMLTTLVGWSVAGLGGALVATAATFFPSSALCAITAFFWSRHREKRWSQLIERSLVPIGIGFMLAGIVTLSQLLAETWSAIIIGLVSAMICVLRPQTNNLMLIAAGAIVNVGIYFLWT